jgi:hypothetical protein
LDRKGLPIGHHDIGFRRAAGFRMSEDVGSQIRIAVDDWGRLCSSLFWKHVLSFLSFVMRHWQLSAD